MVHNISVRDAEQSDIQMLSNLGGLLVAKCLNLRSDKKKISKLIQSAMSSKAHKLIVAEKDGVIVGSMLTLSDQFMFAEKMYAQIVGLYSNIDWASTEMLKHTMDWVLKRKAIQLVTYSMPVKTDLDKLLLNNDFEHSGSMLVWRRYGISK